MEDVMGQKEELDQFITEEDEQNENKEEHEPSNEVIVDPDVPPSPNIAHPH
jgi:hypothetical protein